MERKILRPPGPPPGPPGTTPAGERRQPPRPPPVHLHRQPPGPPPIVNPASRPPQPPPMGMGGIHGRQPPGAPPGAPGLQKRGAPPVGHQPMRHAQRPPPQLRPPPPQQPQQPAKWERATAPDGRPYYFNTITKETKWILPTIVRELPVGWTQHVNPDGRIYYYNTATKESTYKNPSEKKKVKVEKKVATKKASRIRVPDTVWCVCTKDGADKKFFFNVQTKKSQWDLPDDLKDKDLPEVPEIKDTHDNDDDDDNDGDDNNKREHVGGDESSAKRARVGDSTTTPYTSIVKSSYHDTLEIDEEDEEALLAAAMAEEAELEAIEMQEQQQQEQQEQQQQLLLLEQQQQQQQQPPQPPPQQPQSPPQQPPQQQPPTSHQPQPPHPPPHHQKPPQPPPHHQKPPQPPPHQQQPPQPPPPHQQQPPQPPPHQHQPPQPPPQQQQQQQQQHQPPQPPPPHQKQPPQPPQQQQPPQQPPQPSPTQQQALPPPDFPPHGSARPHTQLPPGGLPPFGAQPFHPGSFPNMHHQQHGLLRAPPPRIITANERQKKINAEKIKNFAKFSQLLEERAISAFTAWDVEYPKLENEPRYIALEPKERRPVFEKYQLARASVEKAEIVQRKKRTKETFTQLLADANLTTKSRFVDFRAKFGRDKRFKVIEKMKEKSALFQDFITELKANKSKTKHKTANAPQEGFYNLLKEHRVDSNSRWNYIKDKIYDDVRFRAVPREQREVYFRSYVESDGKTSEERSQEEAIRLRQQQVRRDLGASDRARQNERKQFMLTEHTNTFIDLLTDAIRTGDVSWSKRTRDALQSDQRWELCNALSLHEKEAIFNKHIDQLLSKKTGAFYTLVEKLPQIKLMTTWEEALPVLAAETAFLRLSEDVRERQREFEVAMKMWGEKARAEYVELLKESKFITHKTWKLISDEDEGKIVLKELFAVLRNDKRFLELDAIPEEQTSMFMQYVQDLDAKGEPLPPTAQRRENDERIR